MVLWRQSPRQPYQLDITLRLTLQTAAGLHLVQVAVDVELQQHGRVIGRSARRRRRHAVEPQPLQIQFVNEDIDHADRIILSHIVVETFGKQRRLPAICTLNEAAHTHLLPTSAA